MPITGAWLYPILILLALWFALLCRTVWTLLRVAQLGREQRVRSWLTIGGIGFAAMAVAALLLLHLSWISVGLSQRLGDTTVRMLSYGLFLSTLTGFLLSVVGLGKIRLLGIGTCLITGFWWFTVATAAAISMGPPVARHPTNFFIPDGYVGWVEVKYAAQNEPALKKKDGKYICRIPANGLLKTSSPLEAGWAKDEYFYYAEGGSIHVLTNTGWGRGGMIWAGRSQFQQMPDGSRSKEAEYFFFVGTEEQYHHAAPLSEGPFNESKR